MLNKPLIVTVPSSWADAAAGARAIAAIRTAAHRKSFNFLIGFLLSSRSAIECTPAVLRGAHNERRGAGVAAERGTRAARRLAGESSAAAFFSKRKLIWPPQGAPSNEQDAAHAH